MVLELVFKYFLADKIKNTLVELIAGASSDERWRKLVLSFHSNEAFLSVLDASLKRAVTRFVESYPDQLLVEAITANNRFWYNSAVQKAIKEIARQPLTYLELQHSVLQNSFAELVPSAPEERVNEAVRFFLVCLAEEMMNIPQLAPVYQLQFQKASLEQSREMVSVLRELQQDQRQALLALVEVIATRQLSATPSLPPPLLLDSSELPTIPLNIVEQNERLPGLERDKAPFTFADVISPPPSGMLTALFTDIEGSTRLWEHHPVAMKAALARHDTIMRQAIEENNGYVFKTIGDAFCAVFSQPGDALLATLEAQRNLFAEKWSSEIGALKVRMALHTCPVEAKNGDYVGPGLNRISRLMSVANGGQVLISGVTSELLRDQLPTDVALRDLGQHRLRDLIQPEQIFQLISSDLPQDFPPLKTIDAFPNNLPQQLTSFVGREREIREIKGLLTSTTAKTVTRLVTLTGAGGTGKTRLALEVAAGVLSNFEDGVWFLELASLEGETQIVPALTGLLGLKGQSGKSPLANLTEYFSSRRVLLILDNCEHLALGCARLAENLARTCPHLQLITTSREALGVAGERVFPVPPLSLPTNKRGLSSLEALLSYEAARLFMARAQAANPNFWLTESQISVLVSLLEQLDGIPLAIELAAARIKVLALEQISSRLADRFRLLTGGSRTALPRQQTLKALVDWSYDLLTEAEQMLFRRLAVFTRSWTLEASENICSGNGVEEYEVLDLLAQLVNKSLVIVEEVEEPSTGRLETRYRLLETLREYALEKLLEAGEDEPWDKAIAYFSATVQPIPGFKRGNERPILD